MTCAYCSMAHPTSRCNRPEGIAARGRKLGVNDIPSLLQAPANEHSREIGRRRANAARARRAIERRWAKEGL